MESVQLSSCSLCPFAQKKNFVDTSGACENFKTVNPHVRPLSWIAYKKTVVEGVGSDPFTASPTVILEHVCDGEPSVGVWSIPLMVDPSGLESSNSIRYL